MQLYVESLFEKSGVYFITDAARTHVRIGESSNVGSRLLDHISSRGKTNTFLLYFLECKNSLEEERKAHNYFVKYKIPEETNSFYRPEIISRIEEYVTKSGSIIVQREKALNTKSKSIITGFYGEKVNLNEHRPKCHFFPDQYATIKHKAGTGEVYRTYLYKGKRVKVSGKFHRMHMNIKRIAKEDTDPDYLIELAAGYQNPKTSSSSINLDEFTEEESKLEQFYA